VVLLEPTLPHEEEGVALRLLQSLDCLSRTIILTNCEDPVRLTEALALGAKGIVMKKSTGSQLMGAIRTVVQGRVWLDEHYIKSICAGTRNRFRLAPWWHWSRLTKRQREIVSLAVRGYANKAIAAKLNLCVGTVTSHLHSIYAKLAVSRRQELAAYKRCFDEFVSETGCEYYPVVGKAG
jgi:DNA-binding NarL/FixJ family response regulator